MCVLRYHCLAADTGGLRNALAGSGGRVVVETPVLLHAWVVGDKGTHNLLLAYTAS